MRSFIQREIDKIEKALTTSRAEEVICQLKSARQALEWALDPSGLNKSPYNMIMGEESFSEQMRKKYPSIFENEEPQLHPPSSSLSSQDL